MTLAQNRRKLALRVYNYSVLDRLDQPQEWRINAQLRARSAETLAPATPEPVRLRGRARLNPLPYALSRSDGGGYAIRVQTPQDGEIGALWEPTHLAQLEGVLFEAVMGGAISGHITAFHKGALNSAQVKEQMLAVKPRISQTWADVLVDVLHRHVNFIQYNGWSEKASQQFRQILKLIDSPSYLTIESTPLWLPNAHRQQFVHSRTFFLVHRTQADTVYNELALIDHHQKQLRARADGERATRRLEKKQQIDHPLLGQAVIAPWQNGDWYVATLVEARRPEFNEHPFCVLWADTGKQQWVAHFEHWNTEFDCSALEMPPIDRAGAS